MTTQKYFIFLTLALLFMLPNTVSAATISLHATPATVGVGDIVQVSILLDSAAATNAFSGELVYSVAALEPISVSDGNSIVNMWITRPVIVGTGTPITFTGITPGGFSGDKGVLFSVLFRAKAIGTATVSLRNVEVLRNDGVGGNEPTTTKLLVFSIGAKSLGGYTEPVDQTPPESFTASLGSDPQLFIGKAYVAFTTADKGSGVDHYIIAESRLPSFLFKFFPLTWIETASPYVLTDQNLTSTIYIKAVDRSGNERLSVYPLQHLFTVYEKVVLLVILIGAVLLWQSRWGRRLRLNL